MTPAEKLCKYYYYFWGSPSCSCGSSVDFDGMFPELQELEKFLPGSLLQGQEGSGFLLQILVSGQDNLCSFLGFPVPGVFEELFQRLLIQVLKDVGHGFLTQSSVEVIAMNGWADSQGGGHGWLDTGLLLTTSKDVRGSLKDGLVVS